MDREKDTGRGKRLREKEGERDTQSIEKIKIEIKR